METWDGTIFDRRPRTYLFFVLLLTIPGCGGRGAATVTGTVNYQGKALPAGTVKFYGPNDQVASALISDDGSYEATNVPVGPVKIAVSTPLPPPPEIVKAAREGKRRFGVGNVISVDNNAVSIPAKYNDPAKSGLSLTVTAGSQPFTIDLK
jgi:hypothetical protein